MNVAAERPMEHPGDVPLDVRNVTKRFKRKGRRPAGSGGPRRRRGAHTAVDSVSFRMEPREIYGVIGANGSGKSTLIRMLSTLLIPDEGEISLFGRDVVADPAAARPLL
ncbi:MAG TPA: ATP-binding cassette domain-containing protein, partial [Acidimicrobiia bacterium]|nr:ATP-binding cassette domain-containing protein [Acidimicrobiia bacterium]